MYTCATYIYWSHVLIQGPDWLMVTWPTPCYFLPLCVCTCVRMCVCRLCARGVPTVLWLSSAGRGWLLQRFVHKQFNWSSHWEYHRTHIITCTRCTGWCVIVNSILLVCTNWTTIPTPVQKTPAQRCLTCTIGCTQSKNCPTPPGPYRHLSALSRSKRGQTLTFCIAN